ncbi:unnamed protein product [Closterium sp. NIES-65]|nr:unnamed protein product [Closterium sp. NIES-65]
MAPARPDDSRVKKQFGFPLFCGAWAPTKGPTAGAQGEEGLVVLAGGGGAGRHGIKSKIIACKYSFAADELSEVTRLNITTHRSPSLPFHIIAPLCTALHHHAWQVFSLSTGVNPAFKITAHPNGDGLIAAFADACRLFQVTPGEGEGGTAGKAEEVEGKEGGAGAERGGEVVAARRGSEEAVPLAQLQLVPIYVRLKWLGPREEEEEEGEEKGEGVGGEGEGAGEGGNGNGGKDEGEKGEKKGKGEEGETAAEVKCLLFSADGCRVVAGSEDGRVRVFEWPSMDVLMDVPRAHTSSLRDADINLESSLVATTADTGPLRVWSVRKGTALATLSIAEGGARFGLCRFSRDPSKPLLYSTCVKGGKGWVVVWETAAWKRVAVRKIHNDPISAFAISPDSSLLATGTPEGNVFIVDARTLSVRQRVVGAHLVFVTALDFSPNSRALLSVSGDSSARVTAVAAKPAGQGWVTCLILTALALLAIALLLSASDLLLLLLGPDIAAQVQLFIDRLVGPILAAQLQAIASRFLGPDVAAHLRALLLRLQGLLVAQRQG